MILGSHRRANLRAWLPFLWYAVPTVPLALTAMYAKLRWLELDGFRTVARALGRPDGPSFSILERLSFFRGDLLTASVVLPLFAVLIARVLRVRWRAPMVAAVCVLGLLALYLQTQSLGQVGRFLPAQMWWSGIRFALERTYVAVAYVSAPGLIKIAAMIAATAVLAAWASRRAATPTAEHPAWRTIGSVIWGLALVAAAAAYFPSIRPSAFHRAYLGQALLAFSGTSTRDVSTLVALDPHDLAARYRALVGAAASARDDQYWARSEGADVVIVVLETAPAKCLDFGGSLTDLPNLQKLRQHALVATGHYAPAPYSSLSNFSLLTSWYPPESASRYVDRQGSKRIPSFLWRLRDLGYETVLYEAFEDRFENDPAMYTLLGVARHVVSDREAGQLLRWAQIAHADSAALQALLTDIASWKARQGRFAIVFAPQFSHDPWYDVTSGRARSPVERCRALMAVADQWIGAIDSAVARAGLGEQSIVVVTSDHGVRTEVGDSLFQPGIMDASSFHVPLMIHSHTAFDSTVTVSAISSTVDVMPTLLDLLGIERDRDLEQGNALWDKRLADRTTFLTASSYSGSDGYHRRGTFASWNRVTDAVYMKYSPVLHYARTDQVIRTSSAADSITRLVRQFYDLQFAWLERMPTTYALRSPSLGGTRSMPPGTRSTRPR